MAILNRRKNQTIAELEDYYANNKTRSGMAWAMAMFSLVLTIIVVSVLFFGGRWGYRKITNDDKKADTSQTTVEDDSQSSNSDSEQTEEFPSVVTEQAATTSVPNNINPTQPSIVTSKEPNDLPDTGAGAFIYIAPITALIAGYAVSAKRQKQ